MLQAMNPWIAKAIILAGIVGMAVVRTPHIRRSTVIKVVANRKSTLDNVLVALVSIGLFLPLIWSGLPPSAHFVRCRCHLPRDRTVVTSSITCGPGNKLVEHT